MTMVLGICYVLVTVAEKQLALYVTISTSGCDGWLQQRNCHGIDAVWTRRAARDCSGVDAKGVNCDHLDQPDAIYTSNQFYDLSLSPVHPKYMHFCTSGAYFFIIMQPQQASMSFYDIAA